MGNTYVTVCVGLSFSPGGNAPSLQPLRSLVPRCRVNGVPARRGTARSSARAPAQGAREGERQFGSAGRSAGSVLATANVRVCVLLRPLNILAFGQVLRADRIFNQIFCFFTEFPSGWFTCPLLVLTGGVKSSLQSAILASAAWCRSHAVRPTASPESRE